MSKLRFVSSLFVAIVVSAGVVVAADPDVQMFGHTPARNMVNTVDTRKPATSLPHKICQGEMVVVNISSNVSRSRSPVTRSAEKTGPTSMLNSRT